VNVKALDLSPASPISALHVFKFGDGFSEGIPKQKPLPNLLLLGDFYKIGGFF
jgi:hypothetical protein